MSTKTTFKRVALVAVASLGFGVLSTISASAADVAVTAGKITSINGVALTANTNAINTSVGLAVGVTTASQTVTGELRLQIAGKITSYPVGGAVSVTGAEAAAAATDGDANVAGTMTYVNTPPVGACLQTGATDGALLAATTTGTAAGAGFCKMTFTPTVAGTYVMTVWGDLDRDGAIDDNEVTQTFSFTVTSAGAVLGNQFPNSADTTAALTGASLAGVKVSSVGIETVQVSGRTGIQVGFAPQYRLTRNGAAGAIADATGTSNATKYATIAYSVANPAGTAVTVYSAQGGTTASASQAIAGSTTPIALGTDNTAAENTVAKTQSISATTGWPQKGAAVYFAAATAGTYTITAFHDANLDGLVSVGEATATSTVVIAADALPSITMTTYGQSVPADAAAGGNKGHLVKISLKNGTTPASLGLSEVLTITGPTGTIIDDKSSRNADLKLAMVDAGDGVSATLTQSSFDAAGNAYITVGNNTAAGGATYALTATITGGTGAGATGSGSFTVIDPALYVPTVFPDAALTYQNLTGVAGTGRAADAATGPYAFTVKDNTATTVVIGGKPGATTAKAYAANLTDNFGLITGLIGATYTLYSTIGTTATTATSVKSFSVTVPAMASTTAANAVSLAIPVVRTTGPADTVATFNISRATAVATTSYSNTTLDANSMSIRAGVASSNKMTVEVVDQFGNALPNISVNAAIAGRNATTVIPTMLTDANGLVSYTLADTSTSTTLLTDTVTFTPAAGATSTVTINYAAYLPAATITMTTPDSATATATGIKGSVKSDISSLDGAEAGAVDVKVVLKDANGATLPAGIPVTFSVAGTGAAILSTHVTLYTDASGAATTKVYAWLNGDYVVTAKAGAVSATGTIYFRQSAAAAGVQAEARTIKATADGAVVTATVSDRFGNPISGISVVATRVGTGTFNGTSSLTGTTNSSGQVQFVLSNGTADVTVAFDSPTFGASAATKGYKDAGITALTAYTAGTTVLAEEGVGASFDAAGVNSATVSVADTTAQSAADAAAEATDAANAATDAANAAAEAADAATAAAQDAADAVAALSTQVSEMIDALKKQITALTNLVIKIQKKVKA